MTVLCGLRELVCVLGVLLALGGSPGVAAEPTQSTDATQPAAVTSAEQARSLAVLKAAIQSDQFWPAMHAAEALTQAGESAFVRQQLQPRLAQETDLRQRCGLARELVRAGDRAQVQVLLDVLANPDPYGHVHACESLYKVRQIGDGQLLTAAMNQQDSAAKSLMAAAALASQGNARAFQIIRQRLNPVDTEFGWLSAWILGVLGTPDDAPALLAGRDKVELPRHKAYFNHALALLGNESGQQALLKNLQSDDVVIRADAAYMAGDAKLPSARPKLIALLDDAELDVTIRAAQGLLALSRQADGTAATATANNSTPQIVLKLPPGKNNTRNSEGDFVTLSDGRILFIYTHFLTGRGGDHDAAELRSRVSTDGGRTWSREDQFVARSENGLNLMSVSLLRLQTGEIALFYLNKVSLTDCRPELRLSRDEAQTWSAPVVCINDQVAYYVMNNSRAIQTSSGRLVLPVCMHWPEGTEKPDWAGETMCYLSDDAGKTWRRSRTTQKAFDENGRRMFAQEPGVVELQDEKLLMYSRSDVGVQLLSESHDGGESWSPHRKSDISSPRSPATIRRIPSTGDLLLVWNNHADVPAARKNLRTPLTVAISKDNGTTWQQTKNLYADPAGWYCYTAIHFADDAVLLGHCAGNRDQNNGLAESHVTRFGLDWLYGTVRE